MGTRVLVVDDDADSADLLAENLRDRGLDAHVACDGTTALARGEQLLVEVVVIDLAMPGMSGFDLAKRLRERPALREVRLVAVTGDSDPATRARALASGFAEYFIKPIRVDDLEAAIRRGTPRSPPQS